MDETLHKPLPVLPLEYAPPALDPRNRLLKVMAWLSIGVLVVGTIACCIEVESVIVSGPALAVLGLVMLITGLARRRPSLWAPGAMHLAICMLFVALVNLLNWSPKRAQAPFSFMSIIYTAGTTIGLLMVLRNEKHRAF